MGEDKCASKRVLLFSCLVLVPLGLTVEGENK